MKTKITFVALIFSALCFTTSAQVATWTGPDAGEWSTTASWSTSALPLVGDSVSIPAGKTVTISDNAGTINRLSVSGKLIISAAGTLVVDQAVSPNGAPIVTLAGGEIMNDGSFTVKNTTALASNTVIQFAEDALRDNLFTNNGTFTLDNTIGAYASTTGRGIGLNMITPDRISTFKMGGIMNINIKPGCCFIETNGGGNLTLDGTAVIGSESEYKDLRFIKILSGGNVTIAPTASITLFSAFTNATNGSINVQSATTAAPGSTFKNKGFLKINSGAGSVGYGIYFNPQAAGALNTLTNEGTLIMNGAFPKGSLFVGGNTGAGTISTINNATGATLILFNAEPTAAVIKTSGTTNPVVFNNEGTMNLSSADLVLPTTATLNNTGTINYSYIFTGVKSLKELNGKMYSNASGLVIELQGNAQLILSDITGKTIRTAQLTSSPNVINTNNLKGIYIARIVSENGVYAQKISL